MVTAEWDPVLRPEMAAGMGALIPDLETHLIPKCGHWTQQEKPAELNRILVDWLSGSSRRRRCVDRLARGSDGGAAAARVAGAAQRGGAELGDAEVAEGRRRRGGC